MPRAARFLAAHGQRCTVLRTPPVRGYVSLKRATRSIIDLAARDAYWEGLISVPDVAGGEVVRVGDIKYLVLYAGLDPASGEMAIMTAKTNAVFGHKTKSETADNNGNIIESWVMCGEDIPSFRQIVTYALRQSDPGLLDNTKYIFLAAKSQGIKVLDRIVSGDVSYQVDAVDDATLSGLVRLQASMDTRL